MDRRFLTIFFQLITVLLWLRKDLLASGIDPKRPSNDDRSTIRSKRHIHPWFIDPCESPPCLKLAQRFIKTVNDSLEPCDDFYQYVCGRIAIDGSPKASSAASRNNNRELRNAAHQRAIVKEFEDILNEFPDYEQEQPEALRIERRIYGVCKTIGGRTPEDHEEYKNFLAQTHGNIVFEHENENRPTKLKWQSVDLRYALKGFGFALFDVEVIKHPSGNGERIILVTSPKSRNFTREIINFINSKQNHGRQNRNINLVGRFYNLHRDFSAVKSFTDKLKMILQNKEIYFEETPSRDEMAKNREVLYRPDDDSSPEYAVLTIEDWEKRYYLMSHQGIDHPTKVTSRIEWSFILQELFGQAYLNVYKTDEIMINDTAYFYKLDKLLKVTPNDVLGEFRRIFLNTLDRKVDFVHLKFIAKTIGYVEPGYEPTVIPTISGYRLLWNSCTPGLMVGVAHEYLRRHFPDDDRQTLYDMFEHVRNVLKIERRGDIELQAQLNTSEVVYGYPGWLGNRSFVSEFYGRYSVSNVNIVNQFNMVELILKRKLSSLKDYDLPLIDGPTFFDFLLPEIQVRKDLQRIVMPAAGLASDSYKFFSSQLPPAINYASVGSEVAAKIYFEWLRKRAEDKRTRIVYCVESQILDHTRFGKGLWTERRMAASSYLLGAQTAYYAMPEKETDPIQILGFGVFTSIRLFFITFAESICANEKVLHSDEAELFVNFAVSNLEIFKQAFQCFSNSSMDRQVKCDPWKDRKTF